MKTPLNILILEDSPDDVHLIERELATASIKFTSLVTKSQHEFENGLKTFRPDVILSDHYLPGFNSIEALKILSEYNRQNKLWVPFILISGTVAEDFAVQIIRSGAADFILKDRLKRLPSAIMNALEKSAIEMEKARYLDEIIASERLMKQAEQLANFGCWYVDLLAGTLRWSDETFRIYGYAPGEVMPDHAFFLRHVHPEDVAQVTENRQRLINTLESYEIDFRIIDRHGRLKYLASKVVVKRDDANTPVALIGVNLDITRHKEAEHLLRTSREEYKSLFDQNPDLVFSLDLGGNFIKVNRSMMELSGLTEQELLALNFRPFISELDGQKVEKCFQSAAEGRPQRYRARAVNTKGEEFILDITNMPIIVDGKVIGVHGVAKDTTEKVRLERLVDKAYELARIGGWEVDFSTRKVKWTAIAKELHEVGPDYVPDMETAIDFFFREGNDRDTITRALDEAVEHGKPFDVELRIVTAKGNLRWIRVMGEAEFKNGQCLRLYGSFQDIHEKKSAEEQLKEAYLEKSTILESVGDAFFTIDPNWIVTYWNRIAEEKLQVSRDVIIGRNLWDVFPDAVNLSSYENYHKAIAEKIPVHFEEYYPPRKLWLDVSAYPSSAGLSVYFRDVTALKERVREVEQQNKKLTEIAWTLSHELRGPLARLMGLVQIVKNHPLQEMDRPETLKMILSSADDLDQVIRGIVRKAEDLGL